MKQRELKFRAKVNGSYVYSDSYVNLAFYFDATQSYEQEQYTGLKDKNGVEIYEWDIVKCHYFYEAIGQNLGVYEAEKEIIGEICFQESGLWIQTDNENDSGYLVWIAGLHEESFEVIGKIYENHELLHP